MLKIDKIGSCGEHAYTNEADKNYNIIKLVTIIITVIITILWHIQIPGIFNAWRIFKVLSKV